MSEEQPQTTEKKTSLPKYFVLDTNVILHTHNALTAFDDNIVVLPMTVIEELDNFKTKSDELGRNARAAIRYIDNLRDVEEAYAFNEGTKPPSFTEGVVHNEAGGMIMIVLDGDLPPVDGLERDSPDNRILQAAASINLAHQENDVFVVSKDFNLRVKAAVIGLVPVDWNDQKISSDDMYEGFRSFSVEGVVIDRLYGEGEATLVGADLRPNEFALLTSNTNDSQSAIARAAAPNRVVPINKEWSKAYGISGRSAEQRMALQLLLDPEVRLVALIGSAGTGKTLLALAAGLEAVLRVDEAAVKSGNDPVYGYEKILVTRPIIPMGKDIGYLPGSKDKKMENWMQPVFDNLSFLMHVGPGGGKHTIGKAADRKVQELLDDDVIDLEALTYIRGRSIAKQYIVVDEAQNLTPHEVKTIVSRAGDGTKVVLTGDPYQIDNPYLDTTSNGLIYCAERMKHLPLFGGVVLKKAERSTLAAAAAANL